MSKSVPYFITSINNGQPIGVLPISSVNKNPTPMDVVLNAKVIDWTASQSITEGGPVKLAISVLRNTFQLDGKVVATRIDPEQSQDWYIVPFGASNSLFYIATNEQATEVWTAEYSGGPIRIEPFSEGRPEQIFYFAHSFGK